MGVGQIHFRADQRKSLPSRGAEQLGCFSYNQISSTKLLLLHNICTKMMQAQDLPKLQQALQILQSGKMKIPGPAIEPQWPRDNTFAI